MQLFHFKFAFDETIINRLKIELAAHIKAVFFKVLPLATVQEVIYVIVSPKSRDTMDHARSSSSSAEILLFSTYKPHFFCNFF